MSFLTDLIPLVIFLLLGFGIYMKNKNVSITDLIREIREGFKR